MIVRFLFVLLMCLICCVASLLLLFAVLVRVRVRVVFVGLLMRLCCFVACLIASVIRPLFLCSLCRYSLSRRLYDMFCLSSCCFDSMCCVVSCRVVCLLCVGVSCFLFWLLICSDTGCDVMLYYALCCWIGVVLLCVVWFSLVLF